MADIKPIETYYNGYRFRSRLEARWAVFFDAMGIEYEYEPEGLALSDGTHYLPDFYLPQFYCYFEVKRKGIEDTPEGEIAIKKIRDGSFTDTWAGIICFGDPYDHDMMIFCQDMSEDSGGSYEGRVVFGYYPGTRKPMLFAWDDWRDRAFLTSFDSGHLIPMETDRSYKTLDNPYVTQEVIDAELKARRARFEYGETPPPPTRPRKTMAKEIRFQKRIKEFHYSKKNKPKDKFHLNIDGFYELSKAMNEEEVFSEVFNML